MAKKLSLCVIATMVFASGCQLHVGNNSKEVRPKQPPGEPLAQNQVFNFGDPPQASDIETAVAEHSINISDSQINDIKTTEAGNSIHSLNLLDIMGRDIYSKKYSDEGLEKVTVNIPEGITTGLYLIEINTAKGKVSRKLFVNR